MRYHSLFSIQCATIFATLSIVLTLTTACSKKKNKRNSGGGGATVGTTEEPTEEPEPTPTPDTGNPSVGEEVPPIKGEVSTIDSGAKMELKHLIFQASTAQEEQRYLSEFLIVVRANTDSCIRLKSRPTAGLESEISGDAVNAEADVGPCEAYKTESTDESTAAEDSATDQQSASLLSLNYGSTSGGFSLTESTNLCDIRIFRMPSGQSTRLGQPSGLGPVVTKSARLAVISPGKKVKIWIDEEIGNICSSGSVGDFPITALGPLEQTNSSYAGHKDQLKVEHLTNLATEVEKIYSTLTTTYGAISDLDTNGAVNLFISPDVNRQYFIPSRTNVADRFRATMIEKPEDLAYYNSTTNPLSNEGEVLYLWAPDPAGIFNYGLFPSGNSLTSNYAKGYLATQLMNLINHNSHLLTLKGKIEERWLREALAQLASAYVAGNDYTGLSLGHYLSSRPQEFSLTEPIGERIEADYKHYVRESQLGMRAMFGWFLHSKLCGGTSVAPCAKIKSLIATPKVGIANVEDILQMKFAEILKQFGLSVGVALADDPVSAAALVKSNTETPDPVLLPKLEFIFPSSPRKTFLVNYNVTASATANDPALAGPFPSKDSMLFQPILPDNDMDLKLEKNSVTYILLSGIVNAETDITAYLGPNLNVTFVPLGERNGANRRIHMEKISEAAHLDLRPINLTSTAEADRTNYAPPSHAASYTVNYNREVWVMGSIDNFNINESGESKTVGDTDAYTIEVNPCEGATGADLTACQSQSYRSVIVQVISRDFHKNLTPMFYSTTNSPDIYRGRVIWAALSDLEPQSKDNTEDNIAYALCQSAGNFGGNPGDCANGGVTPTDYDAICTQFASDGICYKDEFNNRILDQATTFDYYVYNTYSNGTGAFYDNFLQVGPFGYPYYTHGTITFVDAPDREDIRHFRPEEVHRQFLNFTYIKDLKKWTYIFYPVIAGQDNSGDGSLVLSEGVNSLTSEQIDGLLIIKQAIDNGALPVGDDLEVYGSTCTGFLALPQSVCSNIPGGEAALDSAVKAALAEKNVRVYCLSFVSTCPGTALSLAGATSTAWLPAERIVRRLDSTPSNNLVTYYRPVYPATSDKVCQGEDVANAGKFQECAINKDKLVSDSDIRTQLNVPAAKLRAGNCDLLTFVDDFHACGDYYSYRFSKAFEQTDEMIPFTYSSQFVPEALKRVDDHNSRPILAGMQAGEVLGFLARTHYQIYYVPTATASKINLLIGGLDESQGKYLLRVRMHDFSDPVDKR